MSVYVGLSRKTYSRSVGSRRKPHLKKKNIIEVSVYVEAPSWSVGICWTPSWNVVPLRRKLLDKCRYTWMWKNPADMSVDGVIPNWVSVYVKNADKVSVYVETTDKVLVYVETADKCQFTWKAQIKCRFAWKAQIKCRFAWKAQIKCRFAWKAQIKCRFAWKAQIKCRFAWKAQIKCRFAWKAQIKCRFTWKPQIKCRFTWKPQIKCRFTWRAIGETPAEMSVDGVIPICSVGLRRNRG